MKKIWRLLKTHVQEDFSPGYYLSVAVLLCVFLAYNYSVQFEDRVLDNIDGWPRLGAYFLFYASGYFLTVALLRFFKPDIAFLKSGVFWKYSLVGLTILTIDSGMPFLQSFLYDRVNIRVAYWAYKVSINGISFFTVLLPLLVFYYLYDRNEKHGYGLNNQKTDLSPYWSLLLLMLPLLLSASFLESFQRQYPMYKANSAHLILGVPAWSTALAYEIAYGLDFITVELLFRGFFVIGLAKVMGRHAIVPMAVIYCMLHFGKPAGEAISSIFGGYILGVIALRTNSIWGGIIVHMGIAWLMELIAFGQTLLR
jgi:hypothetical protein